MELILLVTALYLERQRIQDFFLRRHKIGIDLVLGFFLGTLCCFFEWIQTGIFAGNFSILRLDTLAIVPIGVLLAGWRAGVYEELLFRSMAMGYIHRLTKSAYFAVIGQGFLFWIAHTRYLNTESYWGLTTGVLGLILGWIVYKRKSVVPAMVIHAMLNSYGGAVLSPYEYIMKALMSWIPAH